MTEKPIFPKLHVWVSFGAPDAPVQRLVVHVCPWCFALVTDHELHIDWHNRTDRKIPQ